MKNVYVFSGLGADERVFKYLDFSGFNITFIKWQQPNTEPLNIYASRLLHQIVSPKPILIGLSFGGMVAIEIAKHIDTEIVILIASAKTKNEIPFYYRLAGRLKLHKLLSTGVLRRTNFLTNWLFGTKSNKENGLLQEILKDTDPIFLSWAIDQVVRWKNKEYKGNVFHIHGTSDRILPIRFVKCNMEIKNGGHFLTINKAEEVTKILKDIII